MGRRLYMREIGVAAPTGIVSGGLCKVLRKRRECNRIVRACS